MANPAAAAQHQARGGPAEERAQGTTACLVVSRARARARLRPPPPPAFAAPAAPAAPYFHAPSSCTTRRLSLARCARQPAAAGRERARALRPSIRGLLGGGVLCPLRRRSAGRTVAAPRLVLRRRRRVRHGEGCCCGAKCRI